MIKGQIWGKVLDFKGGFADKPPSARLLSAGTVHLAPMGARCLRRGNSAKHMKSLQDFVGPQNAEIKGNAYVCGYQNWGQTV